MNTNFIRTILNLFTGVTFTSMIANFANCTVDNPATPIIEPSVCSAAWIPVEYQAIAGVAFVIVGLILKAFGGTSATAGQKLAAPVAPIVPKEAAGVGTVTPAMVNAPSGAVVVDAKK